MTRSSSHREASLKEKSAMWNSRGESPAERKCRLAFRHWCCPQARLSKSTRLSMEPAERLKRRARPRLLRTRVTTVRTSLPRVPKERPAARSPVPFGAEAEALQEALRSEQEPVLLARLSQH